jgi:glucose/mannose-6-phosphate isomerase
MKLEYQRYDSQNMFNIIFNFADQLSEAMTIGATLKLSRTYQGIKNIVFAGMGGSAVAGDIVSLLAAPTLRIPAIVIRTYTLPAWVSSDTLVILLSYSGNTEETLAAFEDAHAKRASIIGISSGGCLTKKLIEHGYDRIAIPGGLPPRASPGYLAIPLLYVLHYVHLIPERFIIELKDASNLLKIYRAAWSQVSGTNETWQIAKTIYTSYPLLYGEADSTSVIARRWRSQLAENSKMLASCHDLPELDHNEIVGFESNPELLQRFGVIWLIDKELDPRMQKRLEITKELINQAVAYQLTIQAAGNTLIERMLYLIHFGDWVSFWCAILHKKDPTPVDRIIALKQLLTRS